MSDNEVNEVSEVKREIPLVLTALQGVEGDPHRPKFENLSLMSLENLSNKKFSIVSSLLSSFKPSNRQFWSAGEYGAEKDLQRGLHGSRNRLRVHPKFLHSNATSHKWVFGAIAELLDNAIDEAKNGATFAWIDKITNPRDASPALLIQDDGAGMDPDSLRRCMSFGFSDKHSSSIGQYGNGFKTSTMRLGADVIVFTRHSRASRRLTQSVGLLSYTFLTRTGRDDIVVPMVDYESHDGLSLHKLIRHGEDEFSVNLSTLLIWSPFSTEEELLATFDGIGDHGTKVIVFNLWYNDEGKMELDFDTDPEDIVINGGHKLVRSNNPAVLRNQSHIANQLRYSLRAYSSVLYLNPPPNFTIVLRGKVVEHKALAEELEYLQCIQYKPKLEGGKEAEVVTVIGFTKGAPQVDVHGFSIYHKNRLIIPFCRVVNTSNSRGRGISGVLEANFIKPTHDKQGFERSTLYQKLENRLKEMSNEYWDCHCHLKGHRPRIPTSVPLPVGGISPQAERLVATVGPSCSTSGGLFDYNGSERTGALAKRKQDSHFALGEPLKKQVVEAGVVNQSKPQRRVHDIRIMREANKKMVVEILQLEQSEKELLLKKEALRRELEETQRLYNKLENELGSLYFIKTEKQ